MLNLYLQRLILGLVRNVNHPDGFPNFKTPVETFTIPYKILMAYLYHTIFSVDVKRINNLRFDSFFEGPGRVIDHGGGCVLAAG